MRDLSAGMLAHNALPTTTIATGWRVIRAFDNLSFGWTDWDQNVTIAGVLYRANRGLTPTTAHSTDTFAVDTLEVTAFLDVSTEAELDAGLWDNSTVTVFEYNWANPPASFDNNLTILRHGTLGQVTRKNTNFVAEVRGLSQKLITRIGIAYSPTCPWRHAQWNGTTYVSSIECGVDLVALGFIIDGTLTGIGADPSLIGIDTGNSQATGFFNDGLITFTSGPNIQITREIRRWVNQQFQLYRPFPYPMAAGHAYRAVRGDDKTRETCQVIYNNLVHFLGFDVPGVMAVYKTPTGL